MPSRARLSCLVVLLSGVFTGLAAQSASAFPVVGVNVADVATQAEISTAQALGAKSLRMFLLWSDVQPAKGQLNQQLVTAYVVAVRELAAAGIATDFVVVRAPSWETGSSDPNAPPKNPADFAAFLSDFAGTAGLANNHIAYELWNEEDAPAWWTGAPDPAAYAALVKAAAPAVHAADPTATVVLGPTTGNNYQFIDQLYNQGIAGLTDAVAVHTDNACLTAGPDSVYMENGQVGRFAFLGYKSVHAVMVAHNEGDHPIWMTEFGWNSSQNASGGSACITGGKPSGVTADQQAQFISQAFHCMAGDSYLAVANWFTLNDDPTQTDDGLRHYGLLDPAGAHKPDYDAFHLLATQGDQLSGQCGDFTGPAITIQSPKLGQSYTTSLPLLASATDPQNVTRLTFTYDQGGDIQTFPAPANDQQVGRLWLGAASLSLGLHTINVQAVDKNGNVSNASVQVNKVTVNSLLAVGPATINLKKLGCNAAGVCSLSGSGVGPSGALLPGGKLQVRWQLFKTVIHKRNGKRVKVKQYRTQHKTLRNANKPFAFKQALKPGMWRVQVAFIPPKPLRPSASPFKYFTVAAKKVVKKKTH